MPVADRDKREAEVVDKQVERVYRWMATSKTLPVSGLALMKSLKPARAKSLGVLRRREKV